MESTRDIKGRIKSVTNIQQITKAMKMVAAARLRKAEEKAHGARPYADKVEELLRRASSAAPGYANPLLAERDVKVTGYLIISGDKGLAGAYTSNVMKQTMAEIAGKDPESYRLYVCGKQARNYLKFRGYRMDSYHFGFSDKPSADDSIMLAKEVIDLFNKGEIDEVKVIYTKFYTALRQQVTVTRLLPIEAPEAEEAAEDTVTADGLKVTKGEVPYIFMPDAGAGHRQSASRICTGTDLQRDAAVRGIRTGQPYGRHVGRDRQRDGTHCRPQPDVQQSPSGAGHQ